MKTYISIFIFSVLLFDRASACICADKLSIQDNWEYASQVFVGEVVGIDTSAHLYNAGGQRLVLFTIRILESFKFEIYKNYYYRTFTYMSEGSCDKYFETGKKYLIYANGDSFTGFLTASICSRTNFLDRINENEIKQLQKLYQEFKAENKIPNSMADHEIENYELAFPKSSNDKLIRDNRNLLILSATLATIIILILINYVVRRKKTNP